MYLKKNHFYLMFFVCHSLLADDSALLDSLNNDKSLNDVGDGFFINSARKIHSTSSNTASHSSSSESCNVKVTNRYGKKIVGSCETGETFVCSKQDYRPYGYLCVGPTTSGPFSQSWDADLYEAARKSCGCG